MININMCKNITVRFSQNFSENKVLKKNIIYIIKV